MKYPSNLQQLRKTDKTQHHTTFMLWDGNRQLQEYTHHHIFTTIYDQDSFEPVSRVVQSRDKDCDDLKIYHYHNNHLGTPQELTNEQGEMIWLNYEFAWGGTYQSYYKEQSINGIVIDKDELQPLKFQGQYYDPETSLHYNRFRYYDSDVGMFIQQDPIGLLGGVNVFAYAPNPVQFVDPFGLMFLYRSMSIDEFKKLMESKKWTSTLTAMEGKFFAENFKSAKKWGNKMGHNDDYFMIVSVYIPDEIANKMDKIENLDNIGNARFASLDQLNNSKTKISWFKAVKFDKNQCVF